MGTVFVGAEEEERAFNASISELKALESYKKTVITDDFKKFAEDSSNDYQRLKEDETSFRKFLQLYQMQKSYEQLLASADKQYSQEKDMKKFEERGKINKLRLALDLKTMPTQKLP